MRFERNFVEICCDFWFYSTTGGGSMFRWRGPFCSYILMVKFQSWVIHVEFLFLFDLRLKPCWLHSDVNSRRISMLIDFLELLWVLQRRSVLLRRSASLMLICSKIQADSAILLIEWMSQSIVEVRIKTSSMLFISYEVSVTLCIFLMFSSSSSKFYPPWREDIFWSTFFFMSSWYWFGHFFWIIFLYWRSMYDWIRRLDFSVFPGWLQLLDNDYFFFIMPILLCC